MEQTHIKKSGRNPRVVQEIRNRNLKYSIKRNISVFRVENNSTINYYRAHFEQFHGKPLIELLLKQNDLLFQFTTYIYDSFVCKVRNELIISLTSQLLIMYRKTTFTLEDNRKLGKLLISQLKNAEIGDLNDANLFALSVLKERNPDIDIEKLKKNYKDLLRLTILVLLNL